MKVNKEKLVNELNTKWVNKLCPFCGQNNWSIGDDIYTPIHISEDKVVQLGGKSLPLIPITCNNCGYTNFINVLTIKCLEEDVSDGAKDTNNIKSK